MKPRLVGVHASCASQSPYRLRAVIEAAERGGIGGLCLSNAFRPHFEEEDRFSSCRWLATAIENSRLEVGLLGSVTWNWQSLAIAQEICDISAAAKGRFWISMQCGVADAAIPVGLEHSDSLQELTRDIESLRTRCTSTRVSVLVDATSPQLAAWAGRRTDGLCLLESNAATLRRTIDAFDEAGGAGKPTILRLSFSVDFEASWGESSAFSTSGASYKRSPFMSGRPSIPIAVSWDDVSRWVDESFEAGVDSVYLDPIGVDLERFTVACGEHLLPRLTTLRYAA